MCHQLGTARLCTPVWRGTNDAPHLWGEIPGTDSQQLWPGLWRHCQPLLKRHQHRCCRPQVPLSITAICRQHPQPSRDFTIPAAQPGHKHIWKSNFISALTQQKETLHFCHEVFLSLVSSSTASSQGLRDNSSGKRPSPNALILARLLLKDSGTHHLSRERAGAEGRAAREQQNSGSEWGCPSF